MNNPSIINCGVPECRSRAQNAAILAARRFCMVPPMENVADPLPFVRFNLCDKHLVDLRRNYTEVVHDPPLNNYGTIGV